MTIEIQVNHEVLANWVFVGKEVASEELADDDFISPVDAPLIGEDAAMDEGNLESNKIAGVSKAAAGDLPLMLSPPYPWPGTTLIRAADESPGSERRRLSNSSKNAARWAVSA